MGGSGVGLDPGGGSRGASLGGRGMRAMFSPSLWSTISAAKRRRLLNPVRAVDAESPLRAFSARGIDLGVTMRRAPNAASICGSATVFGVVLPFEN
jgi:hypothetical protein